jgi:hypothetical protein
MKLGLQGLDGGESVRRITHALLALDLGARINVDLEAQQVRIEGRLSVADAMAAISRGGCTVAAVVDGTIVDAVFRPRPGEVLAF